MTKRIGLTGGIACGKSEVTSRLIHHRIPVLDTDHVAHDLLKAGEPVHAAVLAAFGKEFLDTQGHLDRRKLGKLVFADPKARTKLNGLMHPEIGKRWRTWLAGQEGPLAVVAIPLLFEAGLEKEFDDILCVWAPETLMKERLIKRNLTETEADLRIQSQWPVDLKAEKSTWIFKNNRTRAALYQQVDAWVQQRIPLEKN
jgi:dephospho-CoA kinase